MNQRCGGLGLFSQNLTHNNFGEHLRAFTALQNFEAILMFDPKNQICHGVPLMLNESSSTQKQPSQTFAPEAF